MCFSCAHMKPIFIGTHIDAETHKALKIACARADTSISAQIKKLITTWARRAK